MSNETVDLDKDLRFVFESQTQGEIDRTALVRPSRFEGNSLDSDDEDSVKCTDDRALTADDIQGQEEGEVDFKDGIKITPFNMHEELEEGHFDSEGMYIFKKETDIRDSWLEDIDWVKVKEGEPILKDNGSDSDLIDDFNEVDAYNSMLEIMGPEETVLKAIRRLGGGKAKQSSAKRWKAKRAKYSVCNEAPNKNMDNMLKLTALADRFLQRGNTEIYQATYEKLKYMVEAGRKNTRIEVEGKQDSDTALDMFTADFDKNVEAGETSNPANQKEVKNVFTDACVDEQKWEYKWSLADEAEIFGPFTNDKMLQWSESGFFKDGCYVRKAESQGQFYSSKRIDFEMYM